MPERPGSGLLPSALEAPLTPRFQHGGVQVVPGVPYVDLPGVRSPELDLYLPPDADGAPVVVFLHGGGWRLGSRRLVGPMYAAPAPSPFVALAERGLAVASVDYRLSGEAVWPAQLQDASAAVAWLRARGAEVGVDTDRMGAWGESAGAQLAAMLGVRGEVAAVAAWYPPTDLAAIAPVLGADPAATGSREALLLGGAVTAQREAAASASPALQVRAGAPPFLLLHGEADRLMPVDQSRRLHRALLEAGAAVELHTYPGADHMWLGTPDVADDALTRTIGFLQRVL